jgi:hypothetical protein
MKNEWKIENIPVPNVKLTAVKKADGLLELQTHIMGYITTELVNLSSQAIRETLIELGWVPPPDKCDGNHDERTACNDPQCWQFKF